MIEDLKRQFLPITMATVLVSSILYLYICDFIILITILSFLVQTLLFAFYNKVRSSDANQAVVFYSIALISVFIVAKITKFVISIYGGPGCFAQWFFGIQMDKTLVIRYTYVCFIWTNLLISFVIYYFTQVMYRSLVMFLIIIIPFILYAKRFATISYFYIVSILALYIAVMIYCRHFQRDQTLFLTAHNSCKKSILIFILLTITIAMLIPKPTIIPLGGEMWQNLGRGGINLASDNGYGRFSSDAYGRFSRFSSGGSDQLNNQLLYKVVATEGLYLRRQTFDLYQGNNWTYDEQYGSRGKVSWYRDNDKQNFNKFIEALETVTSHDKKFSEKYNLTELPKLIDSQKTAIVTLNDHRSSIVLCLNNVINILGIDDRLYGTLNNDLFLKEQLNPKDSYTISYFSEGVDVNNQSIEFLRKFNKNIYERMLWDMVFSLKSKGNSSNEMLDIIYKYTVNGKNAYDYYEDTYQEPSPRIEELAKKITEGLYSDYDKAKALEEYFQKNGYVYDLKYQPGKGNEGAEYFIFESKKGSCSSYATAMTLMARAIGLPARYIEGFLMNEKEDATTYVVKTKDAHAFTEVFISGYGWMTFDATVSGTIEQKTAAINKHTLSKEDILTIVRHGILALLLLAIIIIILPFIKEFSFRVRLKYLENNAAILLIYTHLKKRFHKKLGIKIDGLTAKMIEDKIYQAYGISIADLTTAFEKVYYGEKVLTTDELNNSYNTYLNFYNATKRKFSVVQG